MQVVDGDGVDVSVLCAYKEVQVVTGDCEGRRVVDPVAMRWLCMCAYNTIHDEYYNGIKPVKFRSHIHMAISLSCQMIAVLSTSTN